MPRMVVVPGLAVRRYVQPACRALAERGHHVRLLTAPGAPGTPADLAEYGQWLAAQLPDEEATDLLVGLSVGAQAAAVAAATVPVRRLALVSPTVDPARRTARPLVGAWLLGGRLEPARLGLEQVPDWVSAGPRRILSATRSALALHLEDVLARVEAPVVLIHGERDVITFHEYAAALAAVPGRRLVGVPGATHSWPYGDGFRFADLMEELLR